MKQNVFFCQLLAFHYQRWILNACSGSGWTEDLSGLITCDISMLEAEGWCCLQSYLSLTRLSEQIQHELN